MYIQPSRVVPRIFFFGTLIWSLNWSVRGPSQLVGSRQYPSLSGIEWGLSTLPFDHCEPHPKVGWKTHFFSHSKVIMIIDVQPISNFQPNVLPSSPQALPMWQPNRAMSRHCVRCLRNSCKRLNWTIRRRKLSWSLNIFHWISYTKLPMPKLMNQLFFGVDPFNNSFGLGVPKFDMPQNLGVDMDVKNTWMNQKPKK